MDKQQQPIDPEVEANVNSNPSEENVMGEKDSAQSKKKNRSASWTVVEEMEEDSQVINIENIQDEGRKQAEPTMFYRHPNDKMVGGVCAGLADYLGWEPVLVRILWVGATFASFGGGFLAYLALWLLLPLGTQQKGKLQPAAIPTQQSKTLPYILLGISAMIFLSNAGILPTLIHGFWGIVGHLFWPVVIAGIGFMLLNRAEGGDWRQNLRNAGQSFRSNVSNVSGKMPTGKSVRSTLNDTRKQLPLRRSSTDKIMMGVCGGISRKVGIDANLVRIGWVALTLFSGGFFGIAAYIALGLIVPEDQIMPTPDRKIKDVQIL